MVAFESPKKLKIIECFFLARSCPANFTEVILREILMGRQRKHSHDGVVAGL